MPPGARGRGRPLDRLGPSSSPDADVATLAGADYAEAVVLARRGELDAGLTMGRRALATAETTDFWHLRTASREALAEVLSRAGQ